MRSGLIAVKLGMTRIYTEEGTQVPVTVLKVDNCQVVAQKTNEKHGYTAVQLGVGVAKIKRLSKAERGHFAAAKVEPKRKLQEFRVSADNTMPVGSEVTVDHFVAGQFVDVTGTSLGKGFQGGMKRWNFKGLRATHGVSVSHRSIGSTGKKMPGHLGSETVTTQNIVVVRTDKDRGLIMLKGSVPGSKGGWVSVRDAVKRKLPAAAPKPGAFKAPIAVAVAAPEAVKE